MADSDKPASDVQVSAQRRRTAQARNEREARLADNLRANIARRKQQTHSRTTDSPAKDDDPAS